VNAVTVSEVRSTLIRPERKEVLFSLPNKKRTISVIDSPKGKIEAEDLEFKVVREEPNVYDLEDGTRLKIRLVLNKVSRGIDPETKKAFFLPNDEPLYNANWGVSIFAEVPRETTKRLKGGN
jgi:hypothetical protein